LFNALLARGRLWGCFDPSFGIAGFVTQSRNKIDA
jgi:hypothetical protein